MTDPLAELKTALLEDYQVASMDTFPKKLAKRVEGVLQEGRGILLMGPVGTGKTHLAAALHNLVRPVMAVYRNPPNEVLFATAQNWLRALRAEFDNKPVSWIEPSDRWTVTDRAENAVHLTIDDYGRDSPSEWAKEQLLGIIDTRCSAHRFTVVTTNLDWPSLKAFDERFADRLKFFERIAMEGPSQRGKR